MWSFLREMIKKGTRIHSPYKRTHTYPYPYEHLRKTETVHFEIDEINMATINMSPTSWFTDLFCKHLSKRCIVDG